MSNQDRDGHYPTLAAVVDESVRDYLRTMAGEPVDDLYEMVLSEVEAPLLRRVLDYTGNNQSHAATLLGLNRGTLRKKLKQHGIEGRG